MLLGIYCAGGLGREVLDLARIINEKEKSWDKIVFIDDVTQKNMVNNVDIFSFAKFKTAFSPDSANIVIANGEPKARQTLFDKVISNGYTLQTLIHPNAFIGSETEICDGVIIQHGCHVSCSATINTNAIIQSLTYIGHDSLIGKDSVLSAHTAISGNCIIGERTFLGINVTVREKVSIGNDVIIGMNSAVVYDVPNNVVAYGNPARIVRDNKGGRVFT